MKTSSLAPLSILILLLYSTIFFLQQISVDAQNNNGSRLVEIACAQTKAPDLCISIIKSDPRSADGDVREFSVIVLEKTLSKAGGLKGRCPVPYKKLGNDVVDAIEKLKAKQIVGMIDDSIKKAISDVSISCSNGDGLVVTLLNIAKDVLNIINYNKVSR